MSDLPQQSRRNSSVNVFGAIAVGKDEPQLIAEYLDCQDFADGTCRLVTHDVRSLARWFTERNREPFIVGRVTTRDIIDYRRHLREERGQAVSTVNRSLVLVRRFFKWLANEGHVSENPAAKVKELRRQQIAPKGLERSQVRRLLREIELRRDDRSQAIVSLILYTGARCGDVVALELDDLLLNERSGFATFRSGKGRKERTVPLPLPCRRALQTYLDSRPPAKTDNVFLGERGPLGARGIRAILDKYSIHCGFKIFPHLLRHTMAHQFLADNNNDLVSLAQILGHESLDTTSRYTKRTHEQLGQAADRLSY